MSQKEETAEVLESTATIVQTMDEARTTEPLIHLLFINRSILYQATKLATKALKRKITTPPDTLKSKARNVALPGDQRI